MISRFVPLVVGLTLAITACAPHKISTVVPTPSPAHQNLLDPAVARVAALMERMPMFNQVVMAPGIRWFRYRPDWYLDEAMETTSGQVWVTYWPKGESSHPPESFGQLYGGTLRHFVLPREPYHDLGFDYYTAPIPFVNGFSLNPWTDVKLHWAILRNGAVVKSSTLPARLRGHDKQIVCKQGSRASGVALYGLFANGQWRPILTWHAWQRATFGMWNHDRDQPLECAGRFAGHFYAFYETGWTGAIFKVSEGAAIPFAAGRPYLVTDHAMILWGDGDQVIEAHSHG